jgi:urease beta subunit
MLSIYYAPGAASPLAAATARTVISVTAAATFGVNWINYKISFDGATSTAVPAKIELCTFTAAGAGTSTAVTIVQTSGNRIATGFTAATNYTVEGTVLAPFDTFYLPVYGGTGIVQLTPGQEPDSAVSQGYAIRVTAPATVNCTGSMGFTRC